jgi:hypothetical protein
VITLDIKPGDRLYAVARTLAAPGICYRSNTARVTVVAHAVGDLIDVVEPDGTPHRINAADLSRTAPRMRMRRSMERKPAGPMEVSGKTYEEIPLF